MRDRALAEWSLALIGALFVVVALLYVLFDAETLLIDILERALPALIGVGLIGFNMWLRQNPAFRGDIVQPALASVSTTIVFVGFVWWILFLVSLESGTPEEIDYLLLNGGAIGALTGAALGYQYTHLKYEQARLDDLAAELKTTNTQLESKVERLDEFASIVSHDLRNPINVASGYLSLARENPHPEAFEKIERALSRADVIITDMLALARHGRTVTDPTPVALHGVAERAWHTVDTDAVTLEVSDNGTLLADSNRLQQLFENLFRNAIDHGGPALTTVRVGTLDGEGVYVEDDGDGFSTDRPQELVAPGRTTTNQGTGYGLAIVDTICDAHGWQLTATTSDDGGARFELTGITLNPE